VVERSIVMPIRLRGEGVGINRAIAVLSLSVLMENLYLTMFGPEYRGLLPFIPGHMGFIPIFADLQKSVNGVTVIGVITFLNFFLNYTKPGLAVRALTQNRELAELCGISTSKLYPVVFAIS